MKNKWLFWLTLVIAAILGLLVGNYLVRAKNAGATFKPECKWCDWEDTSSCVAPCGTTKGTKTQERVCKGEVCTCPTVEWKKYEVLYEKSEDPHKCHRPSDDTLKDVYKMDRETRGDFKKDNKEWLDAKCGTEVLDKESREVKCKAELVECEPTVTPTPTPTETPEPTPTEEPKRGTTEASAPVCNAPAVTTAPAYGWDSCVRKDADTVHCGWGITDGHAQSYGIYYGMSQDKLVWFTEVFGHETSSVDLNFVPAGHVWTKICSIGTCGDQVCGAVVDP